MINTITCTPGEALKVLHAYAPLRYAFYLSGRPGVGKSQLVQRFSDDIGARLFDTRLGQKTAADIGGLPALDHEKKVTTFYEPDIFPPHNIGPTVLFLDEFDKADESVRGSALGVLLERRVGKYTLPQDCVVIAAGNRPEDGGMSAEPTGAVSDRFLHLVVDSTSADWLTWAIENDIRREVMGFIHTHPQYLNATQEMISEGHTIVPGPRSWERVSRLLEIKAPKRIRDIAISGIVGDVAASQFILTADELASMASIERILATPIEKLDDVIPPSISGLYALAYALTASVRVETGGAILDVIAAIPRLRDRKFDNLPLADVQALMATKVIERMLELNIDCTEHPAFIAYNALREGEAQTPSIAA